MTITRGSRRVKKPARSTYFFFSKNINVNMVGDLFRIYIHVCMYITHFGTETTYCPIFRDVPKSGNKEQRIGNQWPAVFCLKISK